MVRSEKLQGKEPSFPSDRRPLRVTGGRRDGRIRDALPAIVLLAAGLSALVIANLWPLGDSRQYIVVTAPGSPLAHSFSVVAMAGGGVIEAGRFSNIVIAASTRPDFPQTLRKAGAWFVLSPGRLRGCFEGGTQGGGA